MEGTEKIYCVDHNNDNSALTAALMNNNRGSGGAEMAALMNNSTNNWMNNPFIYLVWMMFANRMWGNQGENTQNAELQNQIESLRTQMSDNQNSTLLMDAVKGNNTAIGQLASNLNCDFNALQQSVCGVQAAIQNVASQIGFSAERVINAANLGDLNIVTQLKDCCCTTQKTILEASAENRLATCQQTNTLQSALNQGFSGINHALSQGFCVVEYETQKQTCDILNNQNSNTQKILDSLNLHWRDQLALEVQDLKFQKSQLEQNQYLINSLSGGCGCSCSC